MLPGDFLGGPVEGLCTSTVGAQVGPLVRELRSQKPYSQNRKNKKQKTVVVNILWQPATPAAVWERMISPKGSVLSRGTKVHSSLGL